MIKILFILEEISGGTQKHVIDIAKRIDKSEFQIDIIYSTKRNKSFAEESNGTFNRTFGLPISRGGSFSDLPIIVRVRKIIRQNKYDIVHCHSTKAGFVGRLAALLSNHHNILYSPHGFLFCDTRIKLRKFLYLSIEKYLGYFTKVLIATSGSEKDLALKHNIISNKKIITLYNSVDPADYSDFKYVNRVPEKLNGKKADIIIGTISRLIYQKDPLTLIRSFKIINDKIPNTKLIMVGEGPMFGECSNLINELKLQDKVELAGYRSNYKDYCKQFDIFVLSSHYEGLPYALLEAMIMGLPSVGTDVVGIKDVIMHGKNGFLAKEGDHVGIAKAVINLLENPSLLSVFSDNAMKMTTENFNLNKGIKEYQEFYSSFKNGNGTAIQLNPII